ncbi:MAG: ABC transporter ATP-binding protein/permease [Legionella sp.]|nr:MAG: ABC transporter ATP-binding protein/permease [Legionella sp.]
MIRFYPKIPMTSYWQKTISLFKEYFIDSDEKWVAWSLLIGALLCAIGIVSLLVLLNGWSIVFWTALTAKDFSAFLFAIGEFALILAGLVGTHVLKDFLIDKLAIFWRNWLTDRIIKDLFSSKNNYLDLKRFSKDIENVDQRIQEDVEEFVSLTLNLLINFVQSLLSLCTFVTALWVVGGALTFVLGGFNIIIPGYLVWVALLIAASATGIMHWLGSSLKETNILAEGANADFRQELAQLHDDAENIAEEHAENYYQSSLERKNTIIQDTSNQRLNTQIKLTAFQNFYMQLSQILPFLLGAPLYFSGAIDVNQLMQIGNSFGQVYQSLSWFVNAYQDLAAYTASIERITELKHYLEEDSLTANPKEIVRKVRDKDHINVKHLNIQPPQKSSTEFIMQELNLKLKKGEHVLIKGPSGLGKSTLFKAISGTWKYGHGKVSIPADKKFYFLPQKPTLPHDTLRAVLAYPEPADTYSEEQCRAVLREVGGLEKYISQLNVKQPWAKFLSDGQKQRIAFARVLLKKPDWLFLDEATASLDEEAEEHVYQRVRALANTTIVSIAHRSTVEKHHSRILFFGVKEDGTIGIKEGVQSGVTL